MSAGVRPIVLIVEDDDASLRMLVRILQSIADVRQAVNGEQALSLIRMMGELPDLIITDLAMPRMDGITLVEELKTDPRTAAVPILVITAKGGTGDRIEGINAGARYYLVKPFAMNDLLDKVKTILRIP